MLNVIIFLVGLFVIVGGVCVSFEIEKDKFGDNELKFKIKKSSISLFVTGALVCLFATTFTIIPTGYTGVKSIFGQVNKNVMHNGFNWRIPFVESVEKINNKQQDISFDDNKIVSETSERNEVTFSGITVTYKINPEKSSWIVINVSDWEDNLINESLIASAIKSTSKTLNPIDVTNRSILEPKAQENIQKSIDDKYGKNVVYINKVIINNAQFDKAYDNKIAKKQQAQMEYERQQIENKKNVEKAQADADVKIKEAEGNAKSKKIESEADAKANETIEKSLTDKVLRQKMIDKWNGELPKVSSGSNLMLDVSTILNANNK